MAHGEEMNISNEISSTYEYNSSDYSFYNDTEVKTDFRYFYIVHIILSCPVNSYVIWLIVRGTGNGLAAEFFILNLSVCEMILCAQSVFVFSPLRFFWIVGTFLVGLAITGRPLFQCLICVERYLAVVHPVIFLKFKPLRYRLMCSALAWLTAFAFGGVNMISLLILEYYVMLIVLFILFFSIQLFCCVAVLRGLKQSGPGEREREREEENSMKKRAFYLILITTVATTLIYGPYVVSIILSTQKNVSVIAVFIGNFCYSLTGLVQHVFFLYRVGKFNEMKCQ